MRCDAVWWCGASLRTGIRMSNTYYVLPDVLLTLRPYAHQVYVGRTRARVKADPGGLGCWDAEG